MKTFLLLLLPFFASGCSSYEKSVASRQIGASGNLEGGKVFYKVEYR